MVCISMPGPGGRILNLEAEISVNHTWIGDLTYKVVAPDSSVLTLMSRPGLDENNDDGNSCCGDSSNLSSQNSIIFKTNGYIVAENMGLYIDNHEYVCNDDGICDFSPYPDTGPGNSFNDFVGMESAGEWLICAGDSFTGDAGELCSANLIFTTHVGAIAESSVPNGQDINFEQNSFYSFDISNLLEADANLENIWCSFGGGNADQFSVVTNMPITSIAPGDIRSINLSVNMVPVNTMYSSTLTCSFENDLDDTSFSWPVFAWGQYSAVAVSSVPNASLMNFHYNNQYSFDLGNDDSAMLNLMNLQCNFAGIDAGQFYVRNNFPDSGLGPGESVTIELMVNNPPVNSSYNSILISRFNNDIDDGSFSWPVKASGQISAVAISGPIDGTMINLAYDSPSFTINLRNDSSAPIDLNNVQCEFSGRDSSRFSVISTLPIIAIPPSEEVSLNFLAEIPIQGSNFESLLTCTFENDVINNAFSWPVSILGPVIIPAVGKFGLITLTILMLIILNRGRLKKFNKSS